MPTALPPLPEPVAARPNAVAGIVERDEDGLLVLSSATPSPTPGRRVLYINSYGGRAVWRQITRGELPPHHLWGCLELARQGYEVALAEPLAHFDFRRPFPHDLPLLRTISRWLRRDDLIYCAHTLLYWVALLKAVRAFRCRVVSLTYARENLDFARHHDGIIALTGAAADQAKRMAPRARVAHLAWGCDLSFYATLPYSPHWMLACGITHRDPATLAAAARLTHRNIRLISPGLPPAIEWPANVTVIDGGSGWNFQKSAVSYHDLIHHHYAGAAASLVILKNDPEQNTAVGFTNLLEAMALGRPVIATRTGALPSEIDVEAAGCGLHVPANDPKALAFAIEALAANPTAAKRMGETGRRLADKHYNIGRYADQLHAFFETL